MSELEKYQEIKTFALSRAGRRLPGEREMTSQFDLSRPRLRQVLQRLEGEGLVQRRRGSGTYALATQRGALHSVRLVVDAALKLGDDPFFSLLVEHLQGELQTAGAQCVVQRTQAKEGRFTPCDGVLALGVAGLEALKDASPSQPAVGLFAAASAKAGQKLSLLELDDENAGIEVAQKVVEQGARRVYFFGRRAIPAVGERLAGVESELTRAGISLKVIECGLNYAAGLEQGYAFKVLYKGPMAIVAANDWLALGLHTGLQSRDPALRGRVKMFSFDGLALTRRPELGIQSLAVPLDEMARDAVTELQRLKRPGAVGRAIRYRLNWNANLSLRESDR